MKQSFTLILALIAGTALFSQERVMVSKELRNVSQVMKPPVLEAPVNQQPGIPGSNYKFSTPEEEIIGDTRYDDQANASCQNRIYVYDDGTIGATWTRAVNDGSWDDRGTGYNYFDGTTWGTAPTEQIEDEKTGWPSYAPLGENGEIAVAHGSNGLIMSTRDEKGTGEIGRAHV